MSGNVVEFKSPTRPIAQFVRINDAHIRFLELHEAGKLPIERAVFDASRISRQKALIQALKNEGVEIVLDPETAELAAREKIKTHVRKAPWAAIAEGGLLHSSYFDGTFTQANVIRSIAEFAVDCKVDTVLAPTHYLADKDFGGWLSVDYGSCLSLRNELDKLGAKNIAIDYPVLHNHTALNHQETRNEIIKQIVDLPIDNLWIRASGFGGNEPKPQSVRQFLTSLFDFQRAKMPIIMDHSDGLIAQSLLAFGGISGIAHGIGERGSFSAASWHKEPQARDESKPFGRTTYLEIPGLGRRLKAKEVQLLATAKGGHKYLGCQDPCCKHGVKDMIADPRQHAAYQAISPIKKLSEVPDLNRESYFIDKPLLEAEQLARNIKDLNPSKQEVEKTGIDFDNLKFRLGEYHRKIGKFSDVLRFIHDQKEKGAPRAQTCKSRVDNNLSNEKREKR